MGQRGLAAEIKVSGEIKSKTACRSSCLGFFFKSCLSSPLWKSKGAELSAERRDWGWIVQSLLDLRMCLCCQGSPESPLSLRRLICSFTGDPQCVKRSCGKAVLRCRSGQNNPLFCGHGQDLSSNSSFTTLLSSSVWLFGTWPSDCMSKRQTGPWGLQLPLGPDSSTHTTPGQISGGKNYSGIHGSTIENVFHM